MDLKEKICFKCNYYERGRSNHLPRQAAASLQRPEQGEVGAGGSPVHQLLNSHRRDFYDHFIDFFGPKGF